MTLTARHRQALKEELAHHTIVKPEAAGARGEAGFCHPKVARVLTEGQMGGFPVPTGQPPRG